MRIRKHGRRLAQTARRALVRLALGLAKRLPIRAAVEVRERLRLRVKLDYGKADLWLHLDSVAAYHRARSCRKEPETVAWIETYLEPGGVLYDVGANVGAYSLVAVAATGGRSTVVAFEPSSSNFAALSSNLRLNHFEERMIALPCALSDETGLENFHYSDLAAGGSRHHLGELPIDRSVRARQVVAVFRLDRLVELFSLPCPDLLKIDVDGHELHVLRGAGDLLGGSRLRSILVEIDEQAAESREIFTLLARHGFHEAARHPRRQSGLFNCVFLRAPAT